MADGQIRFEDGAAYERMMGTWSRLAGEIFIDWLAPRSGMKWIDVGCGNGAFTELIVQRCGPAEVEGVDPSDAQLAFARSRPAARVARFQQGDALALPFPDDRFDAAVMALVIFFLPDPPKGVAEMARVVCPGGIVAAYAWDLLGGGFPNEPIQAELRAMAVAPLRPPSPSASRMEVLRELWSKAGIEAIEMREISVERTFKDFDDFWSISALGSSVAATLAGMSGAEIGRLKESVRARLPARPDGRITFGARANAIKGRMPG
jgi:ubiquinone/menaquinone biosynthesis C-methylase UbiE